MSASSPVFVTGSTGTVGREVVKSLLRLDANLKLKLLVRDAEKAKQIFSAALPASGASLEYIVGSIENVSSYSAHLAASERAFLLTTETGVPGSFQELEGTFVKAAKAAGVKHLVKLSALGANPGGSYCTLGRQFPIEQVSGLIVSLISLRCIQLEPSAATRILSSSSFNRGSTSPFCDLTCSCQMSSETLISSSNLELTASLYPEISFRP